MRAELILVGGGEHARVVADLAAHATDPFHVVGYVDPRDCGAGMTVPYLGGDDVVLGYPDAQLVLAFASLAAWPRRTGVVRQFNVKTTKWATIVHRGAWVSPTAELGKGTVIMAGAIVQAYARVGAHCVVNTGSIVEHDVVLGDNVHLAPRVIVGGGSSVGPGTYVGMAASIRDHVTVGAETVVGMAAAVVGDVPAESRVKGVPAR